MSLIPSLEQYSLSNLDNILKTTLHPYDDGELFIETSYVERYHMEDSVLQTSNFTHSGGFGLRGVIEDKTVYSFSSDINDQRIKEASNVLSTAITQTDAPLKSIDLTPQSHKSRYSSTNIIQQESFTEKVTTLKAIDQYVRKKDTRVKQVSISLMLEHQSVHIINLEHYCSDQRPLIHFSVGVVVESNGRMERGHYGFGGRDQYHTLINETQWQKAADEALRQALVNLEAQDCPAGQFPVVLGAGWPGVLLHEAVGHGLEADFNRKKTSVFSDRVGEQIASKGVTIVDDGTIENRRGSITIDDEGTEGAYNVLVEDGVLKGYMQDRLNARLMQVKPTGNGRRESYAHTPLPRMTNTYMLAGEHSKEEIIANLDDGIYAVNFGGGQVDITSGKFVFSASEAYYVKNGKIQHPIKGVTLIGNGPEVIQNVRMIGNDLELDPGIGNCGKAGQSIPVGVGQPTLLVDGLTVGGTQT
jgi:TldD protein